MRFSAYLNKHLASSVQRLVLVLLLASGSLLLASPAFAQEQSASTNPYIEPNTNPDVPKNLHTFTQNVITEVASAFVCQLIGVDPVNPNQKCLGIDQKSGKIGFVQNGGGLIGLTTQGIALTYNLPIHSTDYIRYMAQNFGIAKPTYAQTHCVGGIGSCSLAPLVGIWKKFLNITYLMFIIAFIGVGLGIMLRIKIDPRTVMTVENHIPTIISGLILVTFSLPLVGAFIDGMWLTTYFAVNVMADADPKINPENVDKNINSHPIGFVNEVYKGTDVGGLKYDKPEGSGLAQVSAQAGLSVQKVISSILAPSTNLFFSPDMQEKFGDANKKCGDDWLCRLGQLKDAGIGGVINLTLGSLGSLISTIVGWLVSWVIGIIGIIIVLVAIFVALLRLWYELLKAYVVILIHTVLGPFWIVGGVFPGSPVSFTSWLREIVANLLVFPATIIMFLFGKIFMDAFASSSSQMFIPPLIGNPSESQAFGALIGLGIILLTPMVVVMIKDALKAPQFKYSGAIGQALKASPSLIQSAWYHGTNPYGLVAGIERLSKFGIFRSVATRQKLTVAGSAEPKAEVPPQSPGGRGQ